jgi:hypothetical protein
VKVNGNP